MIDCGQIKQGNIGIGDVERVFVRTERELKDYWRHEIDPPSVNTFCNGLF
jgi:hypothetical protein